VGTLSQGQNILELGPGVLFREGMDSLTRGDSKAALQHFRQVLRHSKKAGDKNNIGWALYHMGMVFEGQRQYTEMAQILEQARALFIENDNKFGLASVFHALSLANRELDRNALALEYANQAVKLFQGLGRTLDLAWAYDNLALIHFNLFHRNEILTYAKKARAIFLEFNSQMGLAWNGCNLAWLYSEMGYYDRAKRYYNESFKIFSNLKSKQGMAWSLFGLAMVQRSEYNFDEALKTFEKSRTLYKELDQKDRLGWAFLNEAAILRAMGLETESILYNKRGLQLFSPLRNHNGVAWGFFQIGQIYRDRGQFVKAWQTLREALNLHNDIANKKGVGWASNEIGRTYLDLTDISHARECFIRAKVLAEQLDLGPLKVEVDKNITRLYMEEGLIQKAATQLDLILEQCNKLSARETQVEALLERVRYFCLMGQIKEANDTLLEAETIMLKNNLNRLKDVIKIYKGEILVGLKKTDEAYQVWMEALRQAKENAHRKIYAEALLGLIQIHMKNNDVAQMTPLLIELEKFVRALSSRKIKAKFLILKGMHVFMRSRIIDARIFNQSLQIISSSNLTVLERQTVDLMSDIYHEARKEKEKANCEDLIQRLLNQGSMDLRLVRPRREFFPQLPVSLIV